MHERLPEGDRSHQSGAPTPETVPDGQLIAAPVGWPVLAPEALVGLAGDIVRVIEPFTEADPLAILGNTLVGFGNLVGPKPHSLVEFDQHPPRLNAVLVGETAKGRKGTSWSTPKKMLVEADLEWADRITSGLSSGEGLIFAVRDPDDMGEDPGVKDKRLLVVEQEFAQALKMMRREGNILSPTIRDAWDHGDLHPLTKTSRISAKGAHISIIGHITRDELLKLLTETELANGFANRFLWFLIRRSRVLAEPKRIPTVALEGAVRRLQNAAEFTRGVGEIRRTDEAATLWREIYPALSQGRPGLVGAVLNRAEAQVLRLSCVYALLDSQAEIHPHHLKAALAVWQYVEDSVVRIFPAHKTGDHTVDRIVEALHQRREMDETDIHALFNRNVERAEIERALNLIEAQGIAKPATVTLGVGRPRIVWGVTKKVPGIIS